MRLLLLAASIAKVALLKAPAEISFSSSAVHSSLAFLANLNATLASSAKSSSQNFVSLDNLSTNFFALLLLITTSRNY